MMVSGMTMRIREADEFVTAEAFDSSGRIIGRVIADRGVGRPYVSDSSVEDLFQGQGVGTAIYDALERFLGVRLTHGDIRASISAQRVWRRRLAKHGERLDIDFLYARDFVENEVFYDPGMRQEHLAQRLGKCGFNESSAAVAKMTAKEFSAFVELVKGREPPGPAFDERGE